MIFTLLLQGIKLFSPVNAGSSDFLTFFKSPRELYTILQPGATNWYIMATSNEPLLRQELLLARKSRDQVAIARKAASLGFFQLKRYRNSEALDYFLEAHQAARKLGQPLLIINTGLEVAFVQKSIGAYSSANEVLTELRPALDKLKDSYANGIVYTLMADNFGWLNELGFCQESYQRAARFFLQTDLKQYAAICYLSLGENELRLDDYSAAVNSFKDAMKLTKDPFLRSVILRDQGLVDFKQKKFKEAVSYFKNSDALIANHLQKKLLKETYMQLFTSYSLKQDVNSADQYHELYIKQKKELEGSKLVQIPQERSQILRLLQFKIEQLDSRYIAEQQLELSRMIDERDMDLQAKEHALAIKTVEADSLSELSARQELDLSRKQAQISRYENTRNMLVAISVISLLLLLLFYNRYALKKKSGEVLTRSNAELKLTLERLRDTQDQLVHSEKMAGLGKLTAGIAHEIQNPLNFVRNFSESGIELFDEYRKSTDEQEKAALIIEMQETLGRVKHHAYRADSIVKSMLQHSRAGGTKMEPVDINNLLQDSVQLAFHSMRATLTDFHCRIDESLETIPDVHLLPQQISRVILNLSNNAFYAMYEQVKQGKNMAEPLLRISTRSDGEKVYIALEDNGPGIPPENLQRIFEPFYTTKPSGKGTGLGLSISYDVVRQHGGELIAESEPGKGAKFTITLPLKQQEEKPEW